MLLETGADLVLSISVTTRARRPSEVDGVHYHFIDGERFARMRDGGELLEWAEVHGKLYGDPAGAGRAGAGGRARRSVRHRLAGNPAARRDNCRTTSCGCSCCRHPWPNCAPGSNAAPRTGRNDQTPLANARAEIEHWHEYEYVIVNEDLEVARGRARDPRRRAPAARSAPGLDWARCGTAISRPDLERPWSISAFPSPPRPAHAPAQRSRHIDFLGAPRPVDARCRRAAGRRRPRAS